MKISNEQLAMLDRFSANSYASELALHCKNVFPLLYKMQGERRLKDNIYELIGKAKLSNVTQRGSTQLYFDMSVTLGNEFEIDPMYSDLSFKSKGLSLYNEFNRSLVIYEKFNEYVRNVIGEDNEYIKSFLEHLEGESFYYLNEGSSFNEIYEMLNNIYPQKVEFLGRDKVSALINYSNERLKGYDLNAKKKSSYIILLFVNGCGFEKDIFHLNERAFDITEMDDLKFVSNVKAEIANFVNSVIS